MKNTINKLIVFILILLTGATIGIYLRHNNSTWYLIKKSLVTLINVPEKKWGKEFFIVDLKSSIDNNIQKIYCYKSKLNTKKPLIISLHTWDGDYSQKDDLAEFCKEKELNYIHPDFRGPNRTKNACCSKFALSDIDDAITYAIDNFNVDTSKIYVIGVSGGGYATISTFMKSKHNIKKFSAWASITNLVTWYEESKIRKIENADHILKCTNSTNYLNEEIAKQKSPIFWNTPIEKLKESKLSIYAGVFDGIQGNVPITHSINFYNKTLTDLCVSDTTKYVSVYEKLNLIELKKPLGNFGYIGGRKIFLKKEFKNLRLIIFDGNHEMLTEFALKDLIEN